MNNDEELIETMMEYIENIHDDDNFEEEDYSACDFEDDDDEQNNGKEYTEDRNDEKCGVEREAEDGEVDGEGFEDFFSENAGSWHALDITDDLALAKQGGFIPFSPQSVNENEPPSQCIVGQTSNHKHSKAATALNEIYSNLDLDDIRNEYRALSAYIADQESADDNFIDENFEYMNIKNRMPSAPAVTSSATEKGEQSMKIKRRKLKANKRMTSVTISGNREEVKREEVRHEGSNPKASQKHALSEAEERHRSFLREISLKRKEEEDSAIRAAIKAAMRRKKFKGKLFLFRCRLVIISNACKCSDRNTSTYY